MIFTSAYKIGGTKTGRLASSKFLGEFGANGQNQSDELRRLFVPRKGCRFIQNDLEGAEAVAVALLCREGNFRELVRRKVKIHNFVCLKIFPSKFDKWFTTTQIEALTPQAFHEHVSYKEIIKHCKTLPTEYNLAKRTVHGCLTGDHEVLTPDGWKDISLVARQANSKIAVWDPYEEISIFELPERFIAKPYVGEFLRLDSNQCRMCVTADHNFAYFDDNTRRIATIDAGIIPYLQYEWELPIFVNNKLQSIMARECDLSLPKRIAEVYCFTTRTGLFLCRDKEKKTPFITGNSNYSMGWKTFQENILKETEGAVVLSAAECKRLLNAYFTIFPEVKVFQAEADKAAQEFLPLQNLFGWEIKVIQRYTTSLGRTCVSWRPQSTVGIAGIVGAIRLQAYIEQNGKNWNVLTITHDSNLSEAPITEAEECANVSADCLSFEFISPIDGWKCRIGVEKSIGDNWGKYDEEENPNGLKVIQ